MAYAVAILFTKASILLLYLRLFSPSRTVRYVIYFNLSANVVVYVTGFFVEAFLCTPREAIWNPWIEDYKCLNENAVHMASALLNVLSDFAILVLPISSVWSLQMPKEKKLGVIAVFATGLL